MKDIGNNEYGKFSLGVFYDMELKYGVMAGI